MAVIVSHKIRQWEFGASIPQEDRQVLLRTAKVALAIPIAGKGLPPGTRLLKAYATSAKGPRRVVYLLSVEDGDLFLRFYRDKNDSVGKNITPQNPAFATQLTKHLSALLEDIKAERFDILDDKIRSEIHGASCRRKMRRC